MAQLDWTSYKDLLKKHFWFKKEELTSFFITIVAFALIFSFGEWNKPGKEAFDFAAGLQNFLIALFISFLSVFVHHAVQRLYAIRNGYTIEQKLWWYGVIIGLVIAIISQGKLWFLAATSTTLTTSLKLRIGRKPYGENIGDFAQTAFWGIFSSICLAAFVKTIDTLIFSLPEAFVAKMFIFNLAFAFCNFLPIPPLDGSKIFYESRLKYIFFFSFYLAYLLLIYTLGYYSFIAALIVAGLIWLLYYYYVESK